jgi:hypothetical protein
MNGPPSRLPNQVLGLSSQIGQPSSSFPQVPCVRRPSQVSPRRPSSTSRAWSSCFGSLCCSSRFPCRSRRFAAGAARPRHFHNEGTSSPLRCHRRCDEERGTARRSCHTHIDKRAQIPLLPSLGVITCSCLLGSPAVEPLHRTIDPAESQVYLEALRLQPTLTVGASRGTTSTPSSRPISEQDVKGSTLMRCRSFSFSNR